MKLLRLVSSFLLIVYLVLPPRMPAFATDGKPSLEYQVKASLIFNFLQFVEWPPEMEQNPDSELGICVIGPDVFGNALNSIHGKIVRGLRVVVEKSPSVKNADVDECMVVFISRGIEHEIPDAIALFQGRGVLTVGESAGFLESGGVINFVISSDKVGFEINRDAAVQARLIVSSKLLRLARNVQNS